MENVIEINHLVKAYPMARGLNSPGKHLQAVKDISFFVQKGEVFGILGPNGAGKTTTLEIMEGLKSQTSGLVTVLGLDNLQKTQEIKQKIGVQLQSSDYLPYLTLGELLDLFASIYGQKADKKSLLELVGLTEKEHEPVKNLSGGQKQRFTIASSLVNKPEIIFLDEPTTGLDPAARRSLWNLIKKLNQNQITIVMTTHYMEEAEFLCHRVAIMDSGTILEIDEPRKLIEKISDTTQLSFFTDRSIDAAILNRMPEVKKIHTNYPKITIELKDLDKISEIVQILKQAGIPMSGFTVKTATLEDVYLRLTGKEFLDE